MTVRFADTSIYTGIFPGSYAAARQQWLKRVNEFKGQKQQQSFACPGTGPAGEELVTDSLWLGTENAERVVVVLAGTHGVEGYTGSAIQIDLLRLLIKGVARIPENTALLLVHALTPWGYAWSRRCDADGVDLNRNVVDFSQPMPDTPEYQQIRSALFEQDAAKRQDALLIFAEKYGRTALEKAISGGQYTDADGPFYGGKKPAHGRLVCEMLIKNHALRQRRLAVVDLHTGLGPYGYGEIICDHAPDSAGAAIAQKWYGDAVTLPLAGTSSSVPKLGLLDYLWHAAMHADGCYITLEFGTFSTDQLFDILLADHRLWAQSDNPAARQAHAEIMRQHFCPQDVAWREMVLFRGRQVIGQALSGVSA